MNCSETSERRLLIAVLLDAFQLVQHHAARKSRRPPAFFEACEWFFSDAVGSPFSVRNVCDALDLEIRIVRTAVRAHLQHQAARSSRDRGVRADPAPQQHRPCPRSSRRTLRNVRVGRLAEATTLIGGAR
jgi:hypothetical protein